MTSRVCHSFVLRIPLITKYNHRFVDSVHLVELNGTGEFFAMKAMDKGIMLNRNKVIALSYEVVDVAFKPIISKSISEFSLSPYSDNLSISSNS